MTVRKLNLYVRRRNERLEREAAALRRARDGRDADDNGLPPGWESLEDDFEAARRRGEVRRVTVLGG